MRGLLPGSLSGGEYKLLQQMTTYTWMSKWVEIPFTLLSLPFTSLLIPFSPINSYNFMSIYSCIDCFIFCLLVMCTGEIRWGPRDFFPSSSSPFPDHPDLHPLDGINKWWGPAQLQDFSFQCWLGHWKMTMNCLIALGKAEQCPFDLMKKEEVKTDYSIAVG